jgi:hypothetical protein
VRKAATVAVAVAADARSPDHATIVTATAIVIAGSNQSISGL